MIAGPLILQALIIFWGLVHAFAYTVSVDHQDEILLKTCSGFKETCCRSVNDGCLFLKELFL